MKPEADGTVVVFAAKGQEDGAFLAALDALMKDAGPGNNYTTVSVAHIFADLDRMTQRIASDVSDLQQIRMHIACMAPNYDLNKAEITLPHTRQGGIQELDTPMDDTGFTVY